MAIAIALPGFNDLGRSLTPIFLLIDQDIFSTDFLRLAKKWRKSIDEKFELFAKCTVEFRYFKLFVYLCSGFRCLLKG